MGQTLTLLPDQLGLSPFEQHDAGWRGVDAQLMLNAAGAHIIGAAEASIFCGEEFGGEEQGYALHAFGCIGQPGQHQMDDIVGHIMVAPGDVDLLAIEPVIALAVRLRAGGQGAKVRA